MVNDVAEWRLYYKAANLRYVGHYKTNYFHFMILQRWAQITLYQKRNATKRNDLFNQ